MNAVLQSLNNIEEFSLYFNALPSLETKPQQPKRVYYSRSFKESDDDINVAEELRKLITNLSQGGDGTKAISADCFISVVYRFVPHFRGHRQHDAHEFLRYMLDRLHVELQSVQTIQIDTANSSTPNKMLSKSGSTTTNGLIVEPNSISLRERGKSSIVTNVFGGTLQSEVNIPSLIFSEMWNKDQNLQKICSQVRCLICGMMSKKHDPFLDLSLDIPEKFYKDSDGEGRPICNLSDCLSSFTEVSLASTIPSNLMPHRLTHGLFS